MNTNNYSSGKLVDIAEKLLNGTASKFLFFGTKCHVKGTYKDCKASVSFGQYGNLHIILRSPQFPKLKKWIYLSHTHLPTTDSGAVLTHTGLLHTLSPEQQDKITTIQNFKEWLDIAIIEGTNIQQS